MPLVVASLNERRDVYVVVGMALGAQVAATARVKRRVERKRKKAEAEAKKKRLLDEEGIDESNVLPPDGDGEERGEKADGEDGESSESESEGESEDEGERVGGRNRFGNAFREVADETRARVRIDGFEATVVEVRKEDLAGFLEGLSWKSVVG